jgi:hypothetical protein
MRAFPMSNIATTEPCIAQLDHSPFQVGLGFQPLGPIDVALPLVVTSTDSSPAPTEADKATRFIERIQHICQQVQDIL